MADQLPPQLRDLADVVEVHRERLRRLIEVRGVGGLQELYEQLHGELRERLDQLLRLGRGDTFTAAQLQTTLLQVEEALAGFQGGFVDHLADVGADVQLFAGEDVVDKVTALAPEFRKAGVPLAIENVAIFSGLVADIEPSLLRRYSLNAGNYTLETIREVEAELAQSVALGRTMQDSIEAIDPIIGKTEYWAERVVRTELIEANTRTTQAAMQETAARDLPGLQRQWYTIGRPRHGRVAGTRCPTCGPLHGTVRAMDGTWKVRGRAKPITGPPAHPNCMCTVVPWHPRWGRENAGAVADRVAGA